MYDERDKPCRAERVRPLKMLKVHFYGDVVIDTDISEGMYLLSKLIAVDTSGYGKELKVIQKDEELDFTIISGKQFIRESDEEETAEYYKNKANQAEKNYSDANSERHKAQNKVKELEKELAILKEVCPHKPEEDENAS